MSLKSYSVYRPDIASISWMLEQRIDAPGQSLVTRSVLAVGLRLAKPGTKPPEPDAVPKALKVVADAKEVPHPDTRGPPTRRLARKRGSTGPMTSYKGARRRSWVVGHLDGDRRKVHTTRTSG